MDTPVRKGGLTDSSVSLEVNQNLHRYIKRKGKK